MSSKRSRNKQPQPAAPVPPVQQEQESQGSPNMILAAILVMTLFMAWYYHFSVLGQMKDLVGGLSMLDHRPLGYSAADVDALRDAMNADARGQLSWVHKTAGTIFTVFVALATSLAIGMHGPKVPWRKALYAVPVLFLLVGITHNVVVDQLLGAKDNSLAPLASVLTIVGWVLLILCAVGTVVILVSAFVREFLRRWRDPSLQEGN